jgi:hypothetical protein
MSRTLERVLIGMTLAVLSGIAWAALCTAPGIPWNAARLAPSFALVRGLPIYALRDSGAHLGWFYGPGLPLWYTPMAWLENPTLAVMLATGWNAVTLLLPVWLVVRVALGGRAGAAGVAAKVTLAGAALMLAHPITQSGFFMLHVDAVCLAGVLVACASLQAGAVGGWRPGLPVAAVAVAVAIASKQLAVVFVPATCVWLWREGHGRLLRVWIFWLVVGGGVLAGLLFAVFGAEQLLFNAWLVQSRNPWQGGWSLLGERLGELVRTGWVWWLAMGVAWWLRRKSGREKLPADTASLVRLLAWAAVWQAPFGLVASLKAGGGLNSLHALHYLFVAGLICLAALWAKMREGGGSGTPRAGWVVAAVAVLVLVECGRLTLAREVVWRPYRGLEDLVAQARREPGKFYFPWNPLVTIVAERKIYPFDDALKCLWLAKLEPPREAIRAAVPVGAVIIYHEPSQSYFAMNYFGRKADGAATKPVAQPP